MNPIRRAARWLSDAWMDSPPMTDTAWLILIYALAVVATVGIIYLFAEGLSDTSSRRANGGSMGMKRESLEREKERVGSSSPSLVPAIQPLPRWYSPPYTYQYKLEHSDRYVSKATLRYNLNQIAVRTTNEA